jgi:exopolyphosphatase/guanosine-5'-triphosphate,3'-diphosphate pyrophosphatase
VGRLAAVDLGTNTVRLLVVETEAGSWRSLHEAQRVTRLGQGQQATGGLLPGPMERTAATVAEFVRAAEGLGAAEIRIVATSAVREAANGEDFARRVEALTGRTVEVISGEREAGLALLGVSAGLPALEGSFLLVDIGGGSTEFVRAGAGRPVAAASIRLGVVELAERFPEGAGRAEERYRRLADDVERRVAAELPDAITRPPVPALVGTAGTVTTLAALDLGLARYEARRVQGHVLTRGAIERQLARMLALSPAERAQVPCLEPGRADLLIPGIAIGLSAMTRLGRPSLVVSDWGLREGILCEILGGR